MSNLKEALENGWNDRLFQYYKDLVNPNAVRPQNEFGQEWNDILGTLRGIATPAPAPTPKATPKPTPTPEVEEPKEESND
jgi:hypothetical protein